MVGLGLNCGIKLWFRHEINVTVILDPKNLFSVLILLLSFVSNSVRLSDSWWVGEEFQVVFLIEW